MLRPGRGAMRANTILDQIGFGEILPQPEVRNAHYIARKYLPKR